MHNIQRNLNHPHPFCAIFIQNSLAQICASMSTVHYNYKDGKEF